MCHTALHAVGASVPRSALRSVRRGTHAFGGCSPTGRLRTAPVSRIGDEWRSGREIPHFVRNDTRGANRNDPNGAVALLTKHYYVYIMASLSRVIYVGMTNNLRRRVEEHQQKLVEGFTQKYNVTQLMYYEVTNDVHAALAREKEIKGWRRSKKAALIESVNPTWRDLSGELE
jgi:putative endonuclease